VFAGWRMILYPTVTLLVLLLPVPGLSGPLGWGLRVMIVLQTVTPPATQTMVVTRALGTPEQVHYTGEMILFSYMVALVTIPLFMSLAVILY
jgi:predicted permease